MGKLYLFTRCCDVDLCTTDHIIMTTTLLLLLLVLSSRSVDNQSTTCDDVCASDATEDLREVKHLLANQQQLLQTVVNRLGKYLVAINRLNE